MNTELAIIEKWVNQHSRVLDLGCGDGALLQRLVTNKQVHGYGLDNDVEQINQCLKKGLNVIHQDLNQGIHNFADASYDMVILKHTLQALYRPDTVLQEILRVGKEGIITVHNFSHWYNRYYLTFRSRMPVAKNIPYAWYDTPNFHHSTLRDIHELYETLGIVIKDTMVLNSNNQPIKLLPRWRGATVLYRIASK